MHDKRNKLVDDLRHIGIERIQIDDRTEVVIEQHGRFDWHVSVTHEPDRRYRIGGPPLPDRIIPESWSPGISAFTRRGALRLARKTLREMRRSHRLRALREAS